MELLLQDSLLNCSYHEMAQLYAKRLLSAYTPFAVSNNENSECTACGEEIVKSFRLLR